jgi:D-serine deaminase-like pyridoxal phosphate-dependent protein
MSVVSSLREQWLERYQDQIGRARSEVTTPALILDLDVAKRNIAVMAETCRRSCARTSRSTSRSSCRG